MAGFCNWNPHPRASPPARNSKRTLASKKEAPDHSRHEGEPLHSGLARVAPRLLHKTHDFQGQDWKHAGHQVQDKPSYEGKEHRGKHAAHAGRPDRVCARNNVRAACARRWSARDDQQVQCEVCAAGNAGDFAGQPFYLRRYAHGLARLERVGRCDRDRKHDRAVVSTSLERSEIEISRFGPLDFTCFEPIRQGPRDLCGYAGVTRRIGIGVPAFLHFEPQAHSEWFAGHDSLVLGYQPRGDMGALHWRAILRGDKSGRSDYQNRRNQMEGFHRSDCAVSPARRARAPTN